MVIIGYSGHSYVVCDALLSRGVEVTAYCDSTEKPGNPYDLKYLGSENDPEVRRQLERSGYFVSIGSNEIRGKVTAALTEAFHQLPAKAIHASAVVSPTAKISAGVLVSANATINALAFLGQGVIANTGCVIEHECRVEEFAHICPGTVLAGNVTVGAYSFIGANSVVKHGVSIGRNVIVGAGAVVIRDIPDNVCVAGNPAKIIKTKE